MDSMIRQVNSYHELLRSLIITDSEPVRDIYICNCGYKKNNIFPDDSEFVPFEGHEWGTGIDSHAWFKFHVTIPERMRGKKIVELCVHTERSGWDADNPQFIIYVDGVMRQGMDVNHIYVFLDENKYDYDVYLYAYTGPRLPKAALYVDINLRDPMADRLWYDIFVAKNALYCIDNNTRDYMDTLNVLSKTLTMVNFLEPRGEEYRRTLAEAEAYINEQLYSGKKESDLTTVCIGHTHIDIAWLWTVLQTREKAQRSFATVIELMKQYPEYKFMSSQAFLYKAVKEEAPELYEEIKEMIRQGRWEVEGAMWVEADCNLTSGESLVRQILYGKNFFKDEFGVDSHVLWLPDVFGYAAALPQILRKSGVDWFVTSKISWNDKNTMPYDVFAWKGIDGTEVNTYFLTAQDKGKGTGYGKGTTYVANTNPTMIAGAYNRFQQKELFDEAIVTYGYGDGGGGPTRDMIEVGLRQQHGIAGLPKTKFDFAGNMLKRLENNIKDNPRLPSWRGELYLEFHRGTYTSNAKNKKNNRNCEFLFQDAELLSTEASILSGLAYPQDTLHKSWETILVNQFHDIIPGSSIREVYENCDIEYAELRKTASKIKSDCFRSVVPNIATDKKYVVFNPHSFTGTGIVEVDGRSYFVENVPSKGYKAMNLVPVQSSVQATLDDNGARFESAFYIAEFDENMEITRLYDKENDFEVIPAGSKANTLEIHEDYPDQYDAWEIQEFSNYKKYDFNECESAGIVSDGARRGLRIVRHHGESTVTQTVWFYDNLRRIDFETTADWHSKHRILKAAFPVDINTDRATFEIQFGSVERPTHMNTSWDRQKFETCAHKYCDMSEGNYGVSLLNDCKYGHDVHGNVMKLTLLKCPSYPNEVADEGIHNFTYSILPHSGSLKDSDTVAQAYMLNYPMYAVNAVHYDGACLPEEWSCVSVSEPNVVVETVKKAEKSDDIVIRMYEGSNFRSKVNVKLGFVPDKVFLGDLMENKLSEIEVQKSGFETTFTLDVKPFEIVTVIAKMSN